MKTKMRFITAAAIILAAVTTIRAGSIFLKAKASGNTPGMYSDDTAREVGDILTIEIEEESSVDNETTRSRSKKSSRKAAMEGTANLNNFGAAVIRRGGKTFTFPEVSYDSSSETKFDGAASFDTTRSVNDLISVAVEDVLPNGNMVVLGTRYREIDGETQIVQVSGIIRPSDINYENKISSQRVADFRLVLKLKGHDNRYLNEGWFNWLLNWLNPF